MFKRLSLSILVIILILSTGITAHGAEPALELRVSGGSVLLGENIEVEIVATNPVDLAGGEIILSYDNTLLDFNLKTINLTNGTYIDLQGYGYDLTDADGSVSIAFGLRKDKPLLNAEVSIATISFTASAIGNTEFSINESKLVKGDGSGGYVYETISLPVTSNSINIFKKGSISGTITLSDGSNPLGSIITLNPLIGEAQTAALDSDGAYSFAGLDDGTYTLSVSINGYLEGGGSATITTGSDEIVNIALIRVKEDVNRDGAIGLEDLVAVGNSFGLSVGDTEFNVDADVNDDNIIDLLDLTYITRKIQ